MNQVLQLIPADQLVQEIPLDLSVYDSILYIHTEKTGELDLKVIVKEFVSVNQCRLNYLGKIDV